MRIVGVLGVLLSLSIGAAVAYLYLESKPLQAPEQTQTIEKSIADIRHLQDLDNERSITALRALASPGLKERIELCLPGLAIEFSAPPNSDLQSTR